MCCRASTRARRCHRSAGSLVETIAKIGFGKDAKEARDILGRTYEYFIKEFARAEGHRGGEYFTPAPVARLLVEMLEPYEGRVLRPRLWVVRSVRAVGPLCRGSWWTPGEDLDLRARAQPGYLAHRADEPRDPRPLGRGQVHRGRLAARRRLPKNVKADFVMANPPFNQKEWSTPAILDDVRWANGVPPTGNANYAWIQHFLHHLAPDGRAGFVMANGSLTTMTSGEGKIRESLVRADVVDCVVALPGQLFYTTSIPVCLWFFDRNKASSTERDRREETLIHRRSPDGLEDKSYSDRADRG